MFCTTGEQPKSGFRLCRNKVLHTKRENQTPVCRIISKWRLILSPLIRLTQEHKVLFAILLFSLRNYVFSGLYPQRRNITKEKSRMGYSSERDLMTNTLAFSLLFLHFILPVSLQHSAGWHAGLCSVQNSQNLWCASAGLYCTNSTPWLPLSTLLCHSWSWGEMSKLYKRGFANC